MKCSHCSHLRRGQGGIKIGGRALPTVVVACRCPALPKLLYDGPRVADIELTDVLFFTAAYAATWRICPRDTGDLAPRITNVECLNYDISLLDIDVGFACWQGHATECGPDFDAPPLGGADWSTEFGPSNTPFTFAPGGGAYVAVIFTANASAGVEFTDPPILRVTYYIDPIP